MTTAQDIQTEVVLKAPRAKVWNAITTPEGWTGWFSDGVAGDFRVGETLVLDFGKWGTCYAQVVERVENERFAYRWHPGEDCELEKYPEAEMTTVTFSLKEHPEGTLLTMIESGFDRVPDNRRVTALELNGDGWKWELAELRTFVEQGYRQPFSDYTLRRERVYPTDPATLWELVATPQGLKKWWTKDVSGEFAVGSIAMLQYEHEGQRIDAPIKVTEYVKPQTFAFLSHLENLSGRPFDAFPESEMTTTTFSLTPVEGGTRLVVTESGFENLPKSIRTDRLIGNSDGWALVMDWIGDALG